MKTMKHLGALLATLTILAACSNGQIGVKPDVGSQAFAVGSTSRTDVVNTIGLPQRTEKDEAGNDHYFYERSARLTGMCLACGVVGNTSGIIPGAAVENSQKKARQNAVEFVFNPNGVLISAQ
jgi:hypothetical protein